MLRFRSSSVLGLLLLLSARGQNAFAGAAEQPSTVQISGTVNIPSKYASSEGSKKAHLMLGCKILLHGSPHFEVLPTSDGSFVVDNVPEGQYMLQVSHPQLRFDPVYIEAVRKGPGQLKVAAHLLDFSHGKGLKLKYPLGLAPSDVTNYFEKREEFNILSVLKNPMMLIGLVTCGMVFLMPKVQPPEEGKGRGEEEELDDAGPRIQELPDDAKPTVPAQSGKQGRRKA